MNPRLPPGFRPARNLRHALATGVLLTLAFVLSLTGCSQDRASAKRRQQRARMAAHVPVPLSPRAQIQEFNDQWGEFCRSVVASRNYRAIAPRLAAVFTPDFVGIDAEGNRQEGLDAAINGTTRFLSGIHRLVQANNVIEDLHQGPDDALEVTTSFDWRWEARGSRTRRIENVHSVGRERAIYVLTPTGWRIRESEVLSAEILDD